MLDIPAHRTVTAAEDDEHRAALADLHGWLPTVLDDAVLRDELELALRDAMYSSSCTVAAKVFAAITRRRAPVRLTSAIWLLYIGVELCDDVADGDIRGGAAAEAQATLLAGTVLASLAPQAVASLLPASDVLEPLHYLWRGLQAMSGGQRRDLALFGAPDPDPRAVEAALAKSTAECGMYAALGACVAGARGDAVARWEQFGAQLGYALEVNADCRDALEPVGRGDRDQLRSDLAAAPRDPAACARARDAIAASGSIIACGTLVEAAIARAERILDTLAPPDDAALRALFKEMSFLRPW